MRSVTRRMLGRGGKTNSFWAWYSFKMSFWIVPESVGTLHPRRVGHAHIHGHDHRRRGVDRHRGAHRAQVDSREERLHVRQGVDGDSGPSHLSLGQRIVGVPSEQGGHVEGRREAVTAGAEQLLEAAVGVGGRAEAGELSHRPQARAVHGGVRTTGVGELARATPRPRGRTPARAGRPTWSRTCAWRFGERVEGVLPDARSAIPPYYFNIKVNPSDQSKSPAARRRLGQRVEEGAERSGSSNPRSEKT